MSPALSTAMAVGAGSHHCRRATSTGWVEPEAEQPRLYCVRAGRGPNGIFYLAAGRAVVAETQAFLKQRPQADLATQSWPMLVINGRLHPRFDRGSTSLKARNGVGVGADGKIILAISQ